MIFIYHRVHRVRREKILVLLCALLVLCGEIIHPASTGRGTAKRKSRKYKGR
jgi:hypothetical protein